MFVNVIAQNRYRYHPIARDWIEAVETADGQTLEVGVKSVYNELIVALESFSILSEFGSVVVKAGARTLAGALINIINPNTSWTNNGFVAGDYNRTTGLIGDGVAKYLGSGRNNNADPQNDFSMWNYVTAINSTNNMRYMGGGGVAENGCSIISRNSATALAVYCREDVGTSDAGANAVGLVGITRSAGGSYTSYGNGATFNVPIISETPADREIFEYATNNGGAAQGFSDHRSLAAGIGTAINLATLDAIMDAFAAKITALSL